MTVGPRSGTIRGMWRAPHWTAVLAALLLVAVACEGSPPRPEAAAEAYARQWEQRAYGEMYALLTPAAKQRIGGDGFVSRYRGIADEMTLESITVAVGEVRPVTDEAGKAVEGLVMAPLVARFRTTRVGEFAREVLLPLVRQEGRSWKVDWTPAAIVPELTGERLVRMTRLEPTRGRIVARDGIELATFGDGFVVGVVPGQIRDEAALLKGLAPLVRLAEDEVKKRYASGRPDWFMPIRTMSPETPVAVREKLKVLEGVQLRAVRVRAYPQRTLAAHLVGYVGPITAEQLKKLEARGYREGDRVGQVGLEATLEEVLAGSFGWHLGVVEKDETPAATLAERAPEPGLDVVLTIDPAVQRAVEAALAREERGALVVEDVASGEILAIASHPGFDLNVYGFEDEAGKDRYRNDARKPLFPRATFGQYATGSSFKPITAAAALRERVLQPGEKVPCPVVWTGYGPQWQQRNHETADLGLIDLHTAIARSCNTFFYELGKRLNDKDPKLLPETAKSFGLGKATDVDFVLEAEGLVPTPEWKRTTFTDPGDRVWHPGDATNLAIGQGFLLVTPLQMANYVAAVLNDGTVLKPRAVLRFQKRDGTVVKSFERATLGTANARPEHLALVRDGLRGVVADPDGTAYFPFRGFSVAVLGKSGTAQTTSGAPHAWFIGGAPVEKPRFAVAALVEEKPGILGSQDAARIARLALAAALGVAP